MKSPIGEPIYQARMLGIERHSEYLWEDVDLKVYLEDTHDGSRPTRIVYAHPAPPSELIKEVEGLVSYHDALVAAGRVTTYGMIKHTDALRKLLEELCHAPAKNP